jgi:CHAT domain-containing protein/tetratricopeptide (TPR) repeat protein
MSRSHQRWGRLVFLFILGLLMSCFLVLGGVGSRPLPAIAQDPPSLIVETAAAENQPLADYQAGRYPQAIAGWQRELSQAITEQQRALIYSNLAQAYRQVGQLDQSIRHWQQAIDLYQRIDKSPAGKKLQAQLLTEQAQGYSTLGQHRRAVDLAATALKLVEPNQDVATTAAIQGVLGNAQWALGNYDQAIAANQVALKLAQTLDNPAYVGTAWGNLGNVFSSRARRYQYQAYVAQLESDDREQNRLTQLATQDLAAAQSAYEQSVQASQSLGGMTEIKALLNWNRLLSQSPQRDQTLLQRNRDRVLSLLETQPNSRAKAYAYINLATSLQAGSSSGAVDSQAKNLLDKAAAIAQSLGDQRAASFAVGTLGSFYESAGDLGQAMALTRQSQYLAQQVSAADSLYRWQWQSGRLLARQGQSQQAIGAYRQAISTLQSIRSDILSANRDLQFDVRDSVEPVYRELVELLVDDASGQEIANLKEILDTVELLKLAELQNFFGDDCVQVAQQQQNRPGSALEAQAVDVQAAVVYSIVLDKRTVMILRSPNGTLKSYSISITANQLQERISQLRFSLEDIALETYLDQSKQAYDLLMAPLAADLAATQAKTVVFIHDGVLRSIPMSALYDGQKFLVEKYAIANTLSLSLTSRDSIRRANPALIFGLTAARPPYGALPNVESETIKVQQAIGGTRVLDQGFTFENFEAQLKQGNYSVIHLATHGKFSVDSASTYLLTYDNRITLDDVESAIRLSKQPIDLLTLSACETATGDNRAALGIAGVAVRSGVKSALATLWYINDANTVPLIEEVYNQLRQPGVSKAEALRTAQLKMIANPDLRHPAIWAPFILIGNWA